MTKIKVNWVREREEERERVRGSECVWGCVKWMCYRAGVRVRKERHVYTVCVCVCVLREGLMLSGAGSDPRWETFSPLNLIGMTRTRHCANRPDPSTAANSPDRDRVSFHLIRHMLFSSSYPFVFQL